MQIGKKPLFPRGGVIVYRIRTQQPGGIVKQDRIDIQIQVWYKPGQKTIQQR